MIRALSKKCVPISLLDKVKINLLLSLKNFRHRARKRVSQVDLQENATEQKRNTRQQEVTLLASSDSSDLDYWWEPDPVDPNEDWYVLGTNLYGTISSHPEVNSAHNQLKHFLDNLEMELLRLMHGLCKKDTCVIPKVDKVLATSLQKLSKDPRLDFGPIGQDGSMDSNSHHQLHWGYENPPTSLLQWDQPITTWSNI